MGSRKERAVGKIARKQLRAKPTKLNPKWKNFRGPKSQTINRKLKRTAREVSQASFVRKNYSINITQSEDPSIRRRAKTLAIQESNGLRRTQKTKRLANGKGPKNQ